MPRPNAARPLHRPVVVVLAAALVAAGLFSLASPPAVADIRHDIATARAQLNRLNAREEVMAERLDAARWHLSTAQTRAQIATKALVRAQRRLASARVAVGRFAAQAYMGGDVQSMSIIAGDASDPTQLLDKMATLQAISRSQQLALGELDGAQREEQQAEATTNAALAVERKLYRDAQDARTAILHQAAQAQTLLSHLQAKQQQLIRAARAAAARRAAQAEAARLARERTLAAQAAVALAAQSVNPAPVLPAAEHGGAGAARTALRVAMRQLGKPYVWGAAGPDTFDCSGLTMYAYAAAGISLTHYTGAQWNEGRHVSQSQLRPGDLVFFNTDAPLGHEGMYIGNGQFVHAPHTGDVVKVSSLSGYYQQTYAGAVRVTG